MSLEEVAVSCAGEEAEVLRVGLARDAQTGLGGELADLLLAHTSQREAQARERVGRERGEHITLVLGDVGGHPQQRVIGVGIDARIVAGSERPRAEPLAELEHRVEADVAVAAYARIGRQAGAVIGEPAVDDAGAKLGAQIDREMGHAKPMRELARAAHGLRGAAARLAVVLGVGPELERDGDGLGTAARDQ
jgi:hypothetical protein